MHLQEPNAAKQQQQQQKTGIQHAGSPLDQRTFLWVTDSGAGKVLKFDALSGTLLAVLGAHGTGLHPLQFGAVADVAFDAGGNVYISDGDGGINSRVVKLDPSLKLVWATGAKESPAFNVSFSSPHSLAFLPGAAGGLLAVADRGNNRLLFLNATTGAPFLPGWTAPFATPSCPRPAVWSVRADPALGRLFVAISNFGSGSACPTASPHVGTIHVLAAPASGASTTPVTLAQVSLAHGFPHELCSDRGSGAVYAAAVDAADLPPGAGLGAVTRYVQHAAGATAETSHPR